MKVKADKKKCGVCGAKIGITNRFAASDGFLCSDCAKKVGAQSFEEIARVASMPIQQIIQEIEKRTDGKTTFSSTKEVESTQTKQVLAIDEENETWCIYSKKSKEIPVIYSFNELIEYETFDGERTSKISGGLGASVAGGIIAGGVGAIVGSNIGKKKKKVSDIHIKIVVNDINNSVIQFNLLPDGPGKSETKVGGFFYNIAIKEMDSISSLLSYIIENKNELESTIESDSSSSADEILKFKNLMDQGIITKEEFEQKKSQLLEI